MSKGNEIVSYHVLSSWDTGRLYMCINFISSTLLFLVISCRYFLVESLEAFYKRIISSANKDTLNSPGLLCIFFISISSLTAQQIPCAPCTDETEVNGCPCLVPYFSGNFPSPLH